MKKKYILPILFLFVSLQLFAQQYADKWYFGSKATMDFTGGSPVAINTSEMDAGEGSASIADPVTGELLFYTDGISVWNSNNVVMPNGIGLAGGLSSTQAALIVPMPGSPDEYYIFTTDQIGGTQGLRYSIVNMTLDGGDGNVTAKNILLKTPVTEKVTAVQDAGTSDFWLLTHGWDNDAFYAFKISSAGIDSAVVSNVGLIHNNDVIQNSYGQMKFNPCGDKVALAAGYLNTVEIFDFDVVTGLVSNPKTISYSDHVYGIEFSPNSDVLYVSTYEVNANLVQYDLTIADLNTMISSAEIVSTTPDIYPLQRGPDGKIYVCRSFSQYLGVIHQPDNVGSVACNYIEMGFDLDPGFMGYNSALGLPNFVASYTGETAFCVGSTNSIDETNSEKLNLIFPNPSSSDFTFVSQQNNERIVILNVSGKQLDAYVNVLNGTTFCFGQNYAAGVYMVKMEDAKGNCSISKVLKTR